MSIRTGDAENWKSCCVQENDTLLHVMETIDRSSMQIAMVVDETFYLKGIITDGDARRAILQKKGTDAPASSIMNTAPLTFCPQDSKSYVISQMRKSDLSQAPLLDDGGRVLGIYLLKELLSKKRRSNPVLLMAGGLGTRLRPLTETIPKPLLRIGNKPIIETILTSFIENGFHRFYFAVNYKSEMIETYFGDGEKWGVEIQYLHEKKRLGTAGALSLLPKNLYEPVIVMNGDLLTKVDFGEFLDYHMLQSAVATMGVREYSWQIPYGVIELKNDQISRIKEKPIHHCYVNAGMYVLSSETVQRVHAEEYLDMPDLFREIVSDGAKTSVYLIRDYWMDIGRMDDFRQAQGEYEDVFGTGSDVHVQE